MNLNKPDEYQCSSGFHYVKKKQPDFFNPAENHFLKNLSKKDFFFE